MSMSDSMKILFQNDLLQNQEQDVLVIDPESEYRQLSRNMHLNQVEDRTKALQVLLEKWQQHRIMKKLKNCRLKPSIFFAAPGSTIEDTMLRSVQGKNVIPNYYSHKCLKCTARNNCIIGHKHNNIVDWMVAIKTEENDELP